MEERTDDGNIATESVCKICRKKCERCHICRNMKKYVDKKCVNCSESDAKALCVVQCLNFRTLLTDLPPICLVLDSYKNNTDMDIAVVLA